MWLKEVDGGDFRSISYLGAFGAMDGFAKSVVHINGCSDMTGYCPGVTHAVSYHVAFMQLVGHGSLRCFG